MAAIDPLVFFRTILHDLTAYSCRKSTLDTDVEIVERKGIAPDRYGNAREEIVVSRKEVPDYMGTAKREVITVQDDSYVLEGVRWEDGPDVDMMLLEVFQRQGRWSRSMLTIVCPDAAPSRVTVFRGTALIRTLPDNMMIGDTLITAREVRKGFTAQTYRSHVNIENLGQWSDEKGLSTIKFGDNYQGGWGDKYPVRMTATLIQYKRDHTGAAPSGLLD